MTPVIAFPVTVTRVEEVATGGERIAGVAVTVRPEITATRLIGGASLVVTLAMGEYLATPLAVGDRLFVTVARQP